MAYSPKDLLQAFAYHYEDRILHDVFNEKRKVTEEFMKKYPTVVEFLRMTNWEYPEYDQDRADQYGLIAFGEAFENVATAYLEEKYGYQSEDIIETMYEDMDTNAPLPGEISVYGSSIIKYPNKTFKVDWLVFITEIERALNPDDPHDENTIGHEKIIETIHVMLDFQETGIITPAYLVEKFRGYYRDEDDDGMGNVEICELIETIRKMRDEGLINGMNQIYLGIYNTEDSYEDMASPVVCMWGRKPYHAMDFEDLLLTDKGYYQGVDEEGLMVLFQNILDFQKEREADEARKRDSQAQA